MSKHKITFEVTIITEPENPAEDAPVDTAEKIEEMLDEILDDYAPESWTFNTRIVKFGEDVA